MNKKLILIFSVIILLVAAGAVFYLQVSRPVKIENLTDLISSRVFACIAGYDIDKTWNKIKTTEIYSQIISSPLLKDSKALEILTNKTDQKWLNQDELLAIFGKEVLLGLFLRNSALEDELGLDFVLLSKITQANRIKEPIVRLLSRLKNENMITTQKYNGFKINTVKHERFKQDLVYLILGDLLILSHSPGIVKEAVDLFKSEYKGSISDDIEFKRVKDRLSDSCLGWAYFDTAKLKQLHKKLEGKDDVLDLELSPINSYLFEFNFDEGIYIKGWSYIDFEKEENAGLKAIWQSVDNSQAETLKFAPLDVAMFSGGNCGDIKLIWSYIKNQIDKVADKADTVSDKGIKQTKQFLLTLNSILGFDLEEEVLPYLGQEYGFSFAGFKEISMPLTIIQSQVQPISLSFPEMFGCIRVTNKDKIATVMHGLWERIVDIGNKQFALMMSLNKDKMQEGGIKETEGKEEQTPQALPLSIESHNYSDINIYSLRLQPVTGLPLGMPENITSPSYCFLGDYLIISSNKSLLKQIINVFNKKLLNLNDSIKFSQVKDNLHPKFHNISYVNPKEFIEPLMGMFGSFLHFKTDDIKQEETRRDFEKFIQLLDILKNIKAIGNTTVYKDNFLEFYSFISVEGV